MAIRRGKKDNRRGKRSRRRRKKGRSKVVGGMR
jgi:hypothetical protein